MTDKNAQAALMVRPTIKLSILIPTHNRKKLLSRVLSALRPQVRQVPGGAEVIVIDDGSTDGTEELLTERVKSREVLFLRQAHEGPAAARNRGARRARGELILFLDDDMLPLPGMVAAHLKAHEEHISPDLATAVLGYPTWVSTNWLEKRFYRHVNEDGVYFAFSLPVDTEDLPFFFFYTCSTSLPRAVFLAHDGFDTDFPRAAYEDIEFGYRAMVAGRPGVPKLKLVLCREARMMHYHHMDFRQLMARQYGLGHDALMMLRKHPELCAWHHLDWAAGLPLLMPWHALLAEAVCRTAEILPIPLFPEFFVHAGAWAWARGVRDALQTEPDFRRVPDAG